MSLSPAGWGRVGAGVMSRILKYSELSPRPYVPPSQAFLQELSLSSPPNVPRTVIAPVVVKPLGIEMDDVSTNVIQEALVMGDDEQRLPPALEIAGF